MAIMKYISLVLVLVHILVIRAYEFHQIGDKHINQGEANHLIRKANAGLWSLRLKMRLLGDPSFLVGGHLMYELEKSSNPDPLGPLQLGNESSLRTVESDSQNAWLEFFQKNEYTDQNNWVTYRGTVGPHRAVCVTSKEINPTTITFLTGTSTCVILQISESYCNGNAYLIPLVGITDMGSTETWGSAQGTLGSAFIYCH